MSQEFLEGQNHRCYIGRGGVTIFNTDHLQKGDTPQKDDLILLDPLEALEIAEYILAQRAPLESCAVELEAHFKQISQAVLTLFSEMRQPHSASHAGSVFDEQELDHALYETYQQLINNQNGQVRAWYDASWLDKFSHEQQEALFWRFFHRHYRQDLLQKFFVSDYLGIAGLPVSWRENEALRDAVEVYLAHAAVLTPDQLETIRTYCLYVIQAPVHFESDGEDERQALEDRLEGIKTVEALQQWVEDARQLGIDPF